MKYICYVAATSCLILEDSEDTIDYIDYVFLNKYHCENFMTLDELKREANKLAEKHGVYEYNFIYSEFYTNNNSALYNC